jgi:hypothetical protein
MKTKNRFGWGVLFFALGAISLAGAVAAAMGFIILAGS